MSLTINKTVVAEQFKIELMDNFTCTGIPQLTEVMIISVFNSLEIDEKVNFLNRLPGFIEFNKENSLLKYDSYYRISNLYDLAERAFQISENYPESIFRNKQQALAYGIIFLSILNNYMECDHLDRILSLNIQ